MSAFIATLMSSFEISLCRILVTYFPARFNISAEIYSNTDTRKSDTVLSNLYWRISCNERNKNYKFTFKSMILLDIKITFWSRFWIWLSGNTTFRFLDLSIAARASVNAHLSIGVGNVFATRSSISWNEKLYQSNEYDASIYNIQYVKCRNILESCAVAVWHKACPTAEGISFQHRKAHLPAL